MKSVVLLFASSVLFAQFSNLAPTADGSTLYFATTYAQKDSGQPTHGKIFVIDSQGLRPYAVRQKEPAEPGFTNYYSLSAPSVTSDGRIVAYAGTRECSLGRPCTAAHLTQTSISGLNLNGRAFVSRNGRYALVYRSDSLDNSSLGLWDLSTGLQLARLPYPANPQSTADDGTSVFAAYGLYLYQNGKLDYLFGPEQCETAVIDRAGAQVVYISRWWDPDAAYSRLRLLDLPTKTTRTLAEGFGEVFQPTLSDDGRRVLFLSTARFSGPGVYGPAQAFLLDLDSSTPTQLTNEPAGIDTAVLAGDGRVAFLFTNTARLLRLDIDSGLTTELIPRTPSCCSGFLPAAGSLYALTGTGLLDSAGNPPLLSLNGQAIPLSSASPTQLTFVVPWELAGQTAAMHVSLTSESSFDLPAATTGAELRPVVRNPAFFPLPPEYGSRGGYGVPFGKAAHQNWDGLISQYSPATRGEFVHLYATGLGPVDATGRVTQPLNCAIPTTDTYVEAPVLYAGLAPGFPGVYQVDLRVPPDLTSILTYSTVIELVCGQAVTTLSLVPAP